MKKGNMILAGVLAAGMSLSLAVPVLAEEEQPGFLDTLKAVGEQIQEAGAPVYEGVDAFLDTMKNEDGSINWDKVGEKLNELGSSLTAGSDESGDLNFEELDAYIAEYDKIYEATDQYVLEMNEGLVPGDAQILSRTIAYADDDISQDEIRILGEFTQQNFTIKDGQMELCGAASIPILFTLTHGDDGYIVKEAKQAEDGEGFAASVRGFCDEVGITKEEYDESVEFCSFNDVFAFIEYMDEHPEIESIEYMGEYRTREDLEEMSDTILSEIFPAE